MKTRTDGLAQVRLDPTLQWFRPRGALWLNATAAPETRVIRLDLSRRSLYAVDALGALRVFFRTADSDAGALRFTEMFGPLVEPDGEHLRRLTIIQAQRVIATAWGAWRAPDEKAFRATKRAHDDFARKLAAMGDPEGSLVFVTAADFPAGTDEVEPRKPDHPLEAALAAGYNAALSASTALAARQAYVAPLLALLPLRTRLDFDGEALILRPLDLLSAMAMVLASRIAVGDASIPCRNKACSNLAPRWFHDGNSMKAVYCKATREPCRKTVERHVKQDRYPQLRGLNRTNFAKAARKLRSEAL